MAANPEYVFFRMAAPVTSGPISGESVAWRNKKARHLPLPLKQPKKQVVVAQEEVITQEEMPQAVTCSQVLQKK